MTAISVIVPFFNAAGTLERCLQALQDQEISFDFEVIAVDNSSTDASASLARRFAGVRLLSESRPGAYAARNCGLRAATGELIAFTDADCVPRTDWLRRLGDAMTDRGAMVVMGRVRPGGSSRALELLDEYTHQKDRAVMTSADAVAYSGHTNNLMARRELFARLGLFDERPRGADVIFVRRVLALHGTDAVRYQSDAIVEHVEIDSVGAYLRKAFIYGRSARLYATLVEPPALRNSQRLEIWRQTVRAGRLSIGDRAMLLALLALGVAIYDAAWLSTRPRSIPAKTAAPAGNAGARP